MIGQLKLIVFWLGSLYVYLILIGLEETIECQCKSIIFINNRQQVLLKEDRIKVLKLKF